MSDVLFDSLYYSELPNTKGCAQWKIELQLFGKGGSVIVGPFKAPRRNHFIRERIGAAPPIGGSSECLNRHTCRTLSKSAQG